MRTIYDKYREKMSRLIKNNDMGSFTFIPDAAFDEFAKYFISRIKKEDEFPFYYYCKLERYNKEKNDFEFSLDLDHLYCATNGSQNDIFEGLPFSDYDIYSVEECLEKLSEIAYLKCFTEDYKNNLMWAHYADGYRGICIKYDITKLEDDKILKNIFPVSYSKERNIYASIESLIDYFEGEKELRATDDAKGIFLQKAKHWSYEKEWRMCFMNDEYESGKKYIKVPFECVSAVYMGPRISQENENKVIKKIKEYEKKYNRTIKIYKMYLDENTYEMISRKLNEEL